MVAAKYVHARMIENYENCPLEQVVVDEKRQTIVRNSNSHYQSVHKTWGA